MNIVTKEVKLPEDFQQLSLLAREIWTEHYTPIIGAKQVNYMLDRFQSAQVMEENVAEGYHYYWVLVDTENTGDGVPAGYIAVKPDGQGVCFLSKIYIHKDFRRQGLAKAMINHVLALWQDCNELWLTVNKYNFDTINAYKKLGFVVTEEMVTDIGSGYVMDDYKMSWKITR